MDFVFLRTKISLRELEIPRFKLNYTRNRVLMVRPSQSLSLRGGSSTPRPYFNSAYIFKVLTNPEREYT